MSAFQKRHYEAIALVMQQTYPPKQSWVMQEAHATAINQWMIDCEGIADMFASDNPAFNRANFIQRCEP